MARRTGPPTSLRSPRVDWSQWADGQWWELRRGTDFTQLPSQALKAARNWGHRHGMTVQGSITGPGRVTVCIRPPQHRRSR